MSDVVLRCPNCGTTQPRQGECEACHEADVRYFCPNHTPGKWLDAPVCAFCGARVGGSRSIEPPAPPPRRRAAPRPPAPRPLSEPPRPREADWPAGDPWGGPREPASVERMEEIGPPPWRVERPPTIRITPLPFLGCLGRLAMLAITALILLALGTCWFLGGGGVVVVRHGDGSAAHGGVASADSPGTTAVGTLAGLGPPDAEPTVGAGAPPCAGRRRATPSQNCAASVDPASASVLAAPCETSCVIASK